MASHAENVSIWWLHHVVWVFCTVSSKHTLKQKCHRVQVKKLSSLPGPEVVYKATSCVASDENAFCNIALPFHSIDTHCFYCVLEPVNIPRRVTSMTLGQSVHWPTFSDVTRKYMGRIDLKDILKAFVHSGLETGIFQENKINTMLWQRKECISPVLQICPALVYKNPHPLSHSHASYILMSRSSTPHSHDYPYYASNLGISQ